MYADSASQVLVAAATFENLLGIEVFDTLFVFDKLFVRKDKIIGSVLVGAVRSCTPG